MPPSLAMNVMIPSIMPSYASSLSSNHSMDLQLQSGQILPRDLQHFAMISFSKAFMSTSKLAERKTLTKPQLLKKPSKNWRSSFARILQVVR